MQTPDSQVVAARFFLALEILKSEKAIRGVQTFTKRYGINRRNLYQFQKDTAKDIFQVAWLSYLVNDYGVSADWLLTGSGEFHRAKTAKKPQTEQM